MENVINDIKNAKTFEEQLEITERAFKEQSWYGFVKWEQIKIFDLILMYECFEDDDTTIWNDETPAEEREKGTAYIQMLRSHLVSVE